MAAPLRDAHAFNFCVSTADELRETLAQASDGGPYVGEADILAFEPGIHATGGMPFHSETLRSNARVGIIGASATDP